MVHDCHVVFCDGFVVHVSYVVVDCFVVHAWYIVIFDGFAVPSQ